MLDETTNETWSPFRSYLVLGVVSLSTFATAMALSVMFIVFPDLVLSFPESTPNQLSWVINIYTIMGASTLVVASSVSERWGRKRALLTGTALFTFCSALAAVAPTVNLLIAARGAQAIATAVAVPAAATIIMEAFPRHRRGTAIAMWGAVGSIGAAAGPAIGGLLVEAGGWRWTFWFNVPLGVAALCAASVVLRESRPTERPPRPDLFGAVVLFFGVAVLVFAVLQTDEWGWTSPHVFGALAVSVALMGYLVVRSRAHPRPVFPPDLFRFRSFTTSSTATGFFAASFFSLQFAGVLLLTESWGYSIREAGLLSAPLFLFTAVTSAVAGPWGDAIGYARVLVVGGLLWVLGCLTFAVTIGATPEFFLWFSVVAVLGLGSGLVWGGMFAASVKDLVPDRLAIGSSTVQTTQRIGNAVGVALTITVFGARAATGGPQAFRDMCIIGAACGTVATALSAWGAMGRRAGASR